MKNEEGFDVSVILFFNILDDQPAQLVKCDCFLFQRFLPQVLKNYKVLRMI